MDVNGFLSQHKLMGGIISRFLEKIGLLKHPVKSLTPEDELWLFNNTAFQSQNDPDAWKAEFVACYFRLDSGDKAATAVADLIEKLGIVHDDEAEMRVKERVEWFLNLIQVGRTVEIEFDAGEGASAREVNSKEIGIASKALAWRLSLRQQKDTELPTGQRHNLTLGPSGNNGISSDAPRIPPPLKDQEAYSDGYIAHSAALLPKGYGKLNGLETMQTIFGEPTGWGVISDIDDTIKVTKVLNRIEVLRHTFALPSTPVPGMSDWYKSMASTLHNPLWFYLSASPYNLYPLLNRFLAESNYPKGTIILRDMSWQEIEAFIYVSLTVGTQEYKVDRIEKIHSWFPQRKMILIGDSTQRDPESYGQIARKYGTSWVKGIFIRVVKGVDEKQEKELNKMERFEKAFKGIRGEGEEKIWRLFEDPEEMKVIVEKLVEREEGKNK